MDKDLIQIIDEHNEQICLPPDHEYRLEYLDKDDEKILAEFLKRERDDKPYIRRYEKWPMFNRKDYYSRPIRYLIRQNKDMPDREKQIRKMVSDPKYRNSEFNRNDFLMLEKFPDIARTISDMEMRLFGCIIAYSKEIAYERGMLPIELVRQLDGREEVCRRTFETRESYEWYMSSILKVNMICCDVLRSYSASVASTVQKQLMHHNAIIRSIAGYTISYASRKMPPEEVTDSYFNDEIAHISYKADMIFGRSIGEADVTSKMISG